MTESQGPPTLKRLWKETDAESLRCYECSRNIGDDALFRTFQLRPRQSYSGNNPPTRIINVGEQDILLFDRHFQCRSDLKYVAVSHVWATTVSEANIHGASAPFETRLQARHHILSGLKRISNGLCAAIDDNTEIWYDYVSVPQWEVSLKKRILRAIADFFSYASFTLVYLPDVSLDTVNSLRHGINARQRIDAVTGICNARWFGRVWTIMEYIRSPNVKVMVKEGQIVGNVNDVLIKEMKELWEAEQRSFQDVHDLEASAQMGSNIIPWNLGPLNEARKRKRLDFAGAFRIFSRRGCQSNADYFHALLGILNTDFETEIPDDPAEATLKIATACMTNGDYSPLLMIPRSHEAYKTDPPLLFRNSGYNDVLAVGFRYTSGFPAYHSESRFGLDTSSIKLECIGKVTFASTSSNSPPPSEAYSFLQCAATTLRFTGPKVKQFIRTITDRLYNIHDDSVQSLIDDGERFQSLRKVLRKWYNKLGSCDLSHQQRFAEEIAEIIGMNKPQPKTQGRKYHETQPTTPLANMHAHGGTIHGNSASLVAARCPGCHDTYVYRAALYHDPTYMRGSMAYRFAGVAYIDARPDRAGILVKDGVVTGRMLWASRACDCRVAEFVDVVLKDLPMRIPRE